MNKFKEKISLNPVMTFIILILITILLSAFLNLIGFEATYNKIDVTTGEYTATSESVESLLSLSGIKYIFTSTVSNFTAFTPLSMLIIVLIGIGIMEKSGFIKTTFTILTKYCKKNTITFALVFFSIIFSIMGDMGYVDEDGFIFVKGRKTDRLTANTGQIWPIDLESILMGTGLVKYCCVSNSKVEGQLTAYIETDENKKDDIIHKLTELIHKSPEYENLDIVFQAVDQIPLTFSGKINRAALRV